MDNQAEQSAKAIINSNDFIKMFIKKYFLRILFFRGLRMIYTKNI